MQSRRVGGPSYSSSDESCLILNAVVEGVGILVVGCPLYSILKTIREGVLAIIFDINYNR